MRRRFFLGRSLVMLAAGVLRSAIARAQALLFRPLERPVVVPLANMSSPWQAWQFVADGKTLSSAATPDQPIRITGMVVRTAPGNSAERFAAVCVRCPHEGCDVGFVPDPNTLPAEVKNDIGHALEHGVYVCPCHNSTFKAEDGARLAGPAPRGLYRFNVTNVSDAALEIGEVEEDVLIFV